MLTGSFRHSLDPKKRIFIPAKLREELGDTFVVAKDIREHCLKICSVEEWEAYIAPIKQQNRKLQEHFFRFLQPSLLWATPDSQGRITLPQELTDYAGIEKNVVVIGCYNHAEIWAEEAYDQIKAAEDQVAMIEELENLGL